MQAVLFHPTRATATTYRPSTTVAPFGVVSFDDGRGGEVSIHTTPAAAHAIADAFNAALAAEKDAAA